MSGGELWRVSLKLSGAKFSLAEPVVIRHSVRDEYDGNVNRGDVVHNATEEHAPEHRPGRHPKGVGVRVPDRGGPLAVCLVPVAVRSQGSEREVCQGENDASCQMQ